MSILSSISSAISSVSSHYNLLSFGANNSTVSAFNELVNNAEAGVQDNLPSNNNTTKSASAQSELSSVLPTRHSAELTQELYDKACGLPEAQTVSLKTTNDASSQKYGHFKGGTVYKTFNGEIDTANKNVMEQDGWIAIDNSSGVYCLFTNGTKSYIIAIKDFTPKPLIEDFTPLYNKLSEQKYANTEVYTNDINVSPAVATTFKEETSIQINNDDVEVNDLVQADRPVQFSTYTKKDYDDNKLYQRTVNEKALKQKAHNYHGIYPKQIGSSVNAAKNDSVYNNIQAVVYDLPDGSSADKTGIASSMSQLFCYQQPDSISYTASAGFEAVSPRGTQQPFQFYTGANAMSLSFALRWHIDEVRTFAKATGKESMSLQEIAEIAENFTRPWYSDSQQESITPKLCKVILPGISEIGYMTQAQISYSGDMSGSYKTGSGVVSGSGTDVKIGNITDYFYSQLEITFELLMVKDVKLLYLSGNKGLQLSIFAENETVTKTEAKKTDNKVKEDKSATATKSNSAKVTAPPGGVYDDLNKVCKEENTSRLTGNSSSENVSKVKTSSPNYSSLYATSSSMSSGG